MENNITPGRQRRISTLPSLNVVARQNIQQQLAHENAMRAIQAQQQAAAAAAAARQAELASIRAKAEAARLKAEKEEEERKKKEAEEKKAGQEAGEESRDFTYNPDDITKLQDEVNATADDTFFGEVQQQSIQVGDDIGVNDITGVSEAYGDIDGDGVDDVRIQTSWGRGESTTNDDGSIDLNPQFQQDVTMLTPAGESWWDNNQSTVEPELENQTTLAEFFANPIPGVDSQNIDLKLNDDAIDRADKEALMGKAPLPGMVSINDLSDAEFESVLGFNFDLFPDRYKTKSYDGEGNIVDGTTTDEFEAKTLKDQFAEVLEAQEVNEFTGEEVSSNPLVDRIRAGESLKEVFGIDAIPTAKESAKEVEDIEEEIITPEKKAEQKAEAAPDGTYFVGGDFTPVSEFFKNEDNVTALDAMPIDKVLDLGPKPAEGTEWNQYDGNSTFEITDPDGRKYTVTKEEWDAYIDHTLTKDFDPNKTLSDMGLKPAPLNDDQISHYLSFDKDGDGKLNDEEKEAYWLDFAKEISDVEGKSMEEAIKEAQRVREKVEAENPELLPPRSASGEQSDVQSEMDKLYYDLEKLEAMRGAKQEELAAMRKEWEATKGNAEKEKGYIKNLLKKSAGFAKDMINGDYDKYVEKVMGSFDKGTRANTAVSESDIKALHKELSLLDAEFRQTWKTWNEYAQDVQGSPDPVKYLQKDIDKYREQQANRMMYEKRSEAFIAQKLYMQAYERTDGALMDPSLIMWNNGAFDPEITALAMKLHVAQEANNSVWLLTDSDFAKLPDTVSRDEYISNSDFQLLLKNNIDPSKAVYIPPMSVTLNKDAYSGQESIDPSYAGTELDRDGDGIVDSTEVTFNTALTDPRGIDKVSDGRMQGLGQGVTDESGADIPVAWHTRTETNGEPQFIDQDGARIKNPLYKETNYDVPLYDRNGDGKIDSTGEKYDKRYEPSWIKRKTGGEQEFGKGVSVREFNVDDTQGWKEQRGAEYVNLNPFDFTPTGGEYGKEAFMRNVVNPNRGVGESGLGAPQLARKFDSYARTGLDYAGDVVEKGFGYASAPFTAIGKGLNKVPLIKDFDVMGRTLPSLFTDIGDSIATAGQEIDEFVDEDAPNFFFDDVPQFLRGGYQTARGRLTGNQQMVDDGKFNLKDSSVDALKFVSAPFESAGQTLKPVAPYVASALSGALANSGGGGGSSSSVASDSSDYKTSNTNKQSFAQGSSPQRTFGDMERGDALGSAGINAGSGVGSLYDGGLDLNTATGQMRYADVYGMDALNSALAERGIQNKLGQTGPELAGERIDINELARDKPDWSVKNRRQKLNMPADNIQELSNAVTKTIKKQDEVESKKDQVIPSLWNGFS